MRQQWQQTTPSLGSSSLRVTWRRSCDGNAELELEETSTATAAVTKYEQLQ